MAQINLGNFGNLVARTPQLQTPNVPDMSSAWEGVSDIQQKVETSQRLRATVKLNEFKIGLKEKLDEVDNDLKNGSIHVKDIHQSYDDKVKDLQSQYLDEIPEGLQEDFKAATDTSLTTSKYDVEKFKDNKVDEEIRANFLALESQIEHRAATDPDAGIKELHEMYDKIGLSSGFSADQLTQRKLAKTSQIQANGLAFAIQNTTDVGALNNLRGKISEYAALDAGQMTALTNSIDSQISHIEGEGKANAYYQIANLSNGADYYSDVMANGGKLSEEDFTNFSGILSELESLNKTNAGKPKEFALQAKIDKLKNASDSYKSVLEVNGMNLAEQNKSVSQSWDEANKSTDIKEKLRLTNIAEAKERAFNYNIKLSKTDPYKIYERESGKSVESIDFTKPETYSQIDDIIKDRMDIAETTKMITGVEVGLLKKEEASQLKTVINSMPPQGQAEFYKSLYSTAGKDKFNATIKQLKQNDESAAVIANLSVIGTPESERAAVEIAHGKRLADEKIVKMNSGVLGMDSFNSAFDTATSGFFAGNSNVAQVAREATLNAYLSLSDKAGQINPDFDQDRFETAFRTAVGGVVDFNGKKVIPPYGMDNDTFNNSATNAIKTTFADNPAYINKIDDMELVMAGGGYPPGSYAVTYGGSRIYYDAEQTKPVVIQVKQ